MQGATGPQGAQGEKGAKGDPGVAGKDGQDGRDFDSDQALAASAALSTPAWLESNENFSISGGFGFSDGETAFGATGIARISGGLSAFVGGAVSTDGNYWAGRAGARYGW